MARLVCEKHGRRVHVFPEQPTVHREDGSRCNTILFKHGGNFFTSVEVMVGRPSEYREDRRRVDHK